MKLEIPKGIIEVFKKTRTRSDGAIEPGLGNACFIVILSQADIKDLWREVPVSYKFELVKMHCSALQVRRDMTYFGHWTMTGEKLEVLSRE